MRKRENSRRLKQTDLGALPLDWDVKKIIDFTDCSSGGTPSTQRKEFWNGSIPWMNSGELNNKKIFNVEGRITELGLKESSAKIIPKGSVLVGLAGQGKTRGTIAINRIELTTNQSIAAILPSPHHDSNYLYFNLDNRYHELRGLSTGGEGRGGLNLSIIRQISIAFPKKEEQTAIASALLDVDDLIIKLEALIEKKKCIKQGAIQELLTGKRRLPGFSGDWKPRILGNIADITKGRGLSKSELSPSGKNSCVLYGELFTKYTEKIDKVHSRTDLEEGLLSQYGDVLIPGSTTTIGIDLAKASALLIKDVLLGGDVNVVRQKDGLYDPVFLAYALTHVEKHSIARKTKGITIYHLHGKDLLDLQIYMPDNSEQAAIAGILSDMDADIEKLRSELTKYQNIKQGMMQALLTGKIRLT